MKERSEDYYRKKILTIPNLLSFFRLCLIPVIVWLYCFEENFPATTLVLALSGLTDVVDGFIARRFHMISDFGKAFDPVADKLTQIVMLFCLVTRFPHMLIPLVILVIKEITAAILNLMAIHKSGEVMGAVWHGKATTVSLYAMMLVHLIWYNITPVASQIMVGLCTVLMLLSAVLYSIRALRILRSRRKPSAMTKTERILRRISVGLCQLFALGTIVMLLVTEQYNRLPLAIVTLVLVLMPEILERLLHCKLSLPLYLFAVLYAIGPMLGQCHNFYYTISWWDKLLHICGGVMFAIVGFYLYEFMSREKKNLLLCVVFALCFSIALAAVWEFFEFGCDRLLGTDMQDDTLITAIHSYMLDDRLGVTGSIENISAVLVDGAPLPGYIDIGLLDTMLDMLLETLGALAVCLLHLLDKGRHPLIRPAKTQTTA